MATTLTRVMNVFRTGSTDLMYPPLGWVGSAAGVKGDLCIMASGYVAVAAATSASIADAAKIAILNESIASTVAADIDAAKLGIEKIDEDTILEMMFATSTGGSLGTPVTAASGIRALVGNVYGMSRNSTGIYYVNKALTGSSANCEVMGIGTTYPYTDAFPTVIVRILGANRMA